MKSEDFNQLTKALFELTPQDHAKLFNEIRQITYDRLSKDAERLAAESKELQEFIKAKLTNV